MRRCVIGNYRKTASFDQMRPLSVPEEHRTHIHGAWDYVSTDPTIVAPENGIVYYVASIRNTVNRSLKEISMEKCPFVFQGNYFYDVYGGIVILISAGRERTHIMTHSYRNQLFEQTGMLPNVQESRKDERFPVCIEHTFRYPKTVKEGDAICRIGNAGFSTGPHVHHEVHPGTTWVPHADRINWEEVLND